MLRSNEILANADKIYLLRGFDSQMDKFDEEYHEMLLNLVRFRNKPLEEYLEALKEEIADHELVKIQLDRNAETNNRFHFMNEICIQEEYLKKKGLKEIYKNISSKYAKEIEEIALKKSERTLERISEGYYG